MAALARWCFQRRTWVLVAWLALVVILGVGGRAAGTAYSNNVTLPGTGSTTALTLLEKAFPGTPKAMTAKVVPDRLTETGLKDALSAALNPWYWLAFTAANSAPMPIISTRAIGNVHMVERTDRNFVHSERRTRTWVTFSLGTPAAGAEVRTLIGLLPPWPALVNGILPIPR